MDAELSLLGKQIFKNAFAKAGLTVLGNVIKKSFTGSGITNK